MTGASSGLGREIARELALRHGANLVLTARRRDRLDALRGELTKGAGVQVEIVPADLSRNGEPDRLFRQAVQGRVLYGAILNAGVTHFGEHLELDWSAFEKLMATNVTSVARLVHLAVPHLIENGSGGGLMLVTSLTALIPVPYQTAYSSTKAFITTLGRGLHHELHNKDVSVTTFVPAAIDTEMIHLSGTVHTWSPKSIMVQAADACAREAVEAFAARRYMYVPRRFNRLQLALAPLLPRAFLGSQLASQFRRALQRVREQRND
ncbi:MAG: SDR family NAD(P)-dependent oxidoreductase [Proteobacteria bacterium]|nr:SDR family NAD(P)-dependent oxidoreductase [Pseudomonadota bacterium]